MEALHAVVVDRDLLRSGEEDHLDALAERLVDLDGLCGHLLLSAAVDELDVLGAPTKCGTCAVNSGVSTADDDDVVADGAVVALGDVTQVVDAELDALRALRRDSRQWIAALETREREASGINTLKIGYNKVFGYYLEITRAHAAKAPDHYIRKQTLVNAERYVTPELKEYEARLLGAQDAITAIEQRIFRELREAVLPQIPSLQATARAIAHLDVLASLAWVAMENGYVRPRVAADRRVEIVSGRHPVVEKVLRAGEYVPNSCSFDAERDTIHIVTGPNMAGKSTYMRQVALICLMAQMGSFVPARQASIGLVDRIFTRIGALDLSLIHI